MYTHLHVSYFPINAATNHQHDVHWEDIPLPVEDNAAQGQPQDLQYINMAYYDVAYRPLIPPAVSSVYSSDMLPPYG